MEEVSTQAEVGALKMGKWNPDRCWFCRQGRSCPLPVKCQPRNESWNWSSPVNDRTAPPPRLPGVASFPGTENPYGCSLCVYTSRINYTGEDGLNITRKSAKQLGKAFAPSWKILRPALSELTAAKLLANRGLTLEAQQKSDRAWETYTHEYTHEMRESYRMGRICVPGKKLPPVGPWKEVLSMRSVVLLCYCTNPTRCHRTILASIFVKLGATYLGEVGWQHD